MRERERKWGPRPTKSNGERNVELERKKKEDSYSSSHLYRGWRNLEVRLEIWRFWRDETSMNVCVILLELLFEHYLNTIGACQVENNTSRIWTCVTAVTTELIWLCESRHLTLSLIAQSGTAVEKQRICMFCLCQCGFSLASSSLVTSHSTCCHTSQL